MKSFQSRVVAAWIVALPIAYGLVVDLHNETTRLRTAPQAEIARKLHASEGISLVGLFVVTFGFLLVLVVVIDWLGKLIQRLFPERDVAAKSVESTNPVA